MNKKNDIPHFILTIIFGVACCIAVGLFFFGFNIFDVKLPFFQFIAYGIIGSVSFSLFQPKRYRDAVYLLIILFILNVVSTGLTRISFLIIHFLYFSSVVIAIFSFSKYFFIQIANIKISRPLVLASMLALFFVMATSLQWVIFAKDGKPFYPLGNLPIGFLIGLGLGIGFELSDYLYSKKITF